jgi:hypothetical protein
MLVVKRKNRLALPGFQPVVARNLAVVSVGFAVARFSRVILAAGKSQLSQELLDRQIRPVRPIFEIVNNFVAGIVGNPASL